MQIRVVTAVETFCQEISAWSFAKLAADPGYFYFHSPAWVKTVWDLWEGPRGSKFFGLLVEREGQLCGWWPLVLSKRTLGYRLQNLGQEISDYALPYLAEPLAPQRAELTAAILQRALQEAPRFTFAQFAGFLYPPDPFRPHTAAELRQWLTAQVPGTWEIGPAVDNRTLDLQAAPLDPALFLSQQLSRNYRENLKRYERKLLQLGALTLELPVAFPDLEPLKEKYFSWYRYQVKGSVRQQQKLAVWWEFYRLLPSSQLAASVLTLAGEAISMIIGFWRAGQFDYFSPVFSPAFQKFGPGKIHLFYLIQHLIKRGCRRLNFLVGNEEYKQHWAKEDYSCWRVRFYHYRRPLATGYWLRYLMR